MRYTQTTINTKYNSCVMIIRESGARAYYARDITATAQLHGQLIRQLTRLGNTPVGGT